MIRLSHIALVLFPAALLAQESTLPDDWASKLQWRSIGPANMSGRIVDLAINPDDPTTWYAATASGGLLKTTNDGTSWEHLFDDQSTVSIGDVEIAPSDPNILWIGTGEENPRNSVSWGDGVYKSTDAGETWTHMGLKESFQIGAVVIHPEDPNTVYVGALGRLWGENEQRGLFKTTDGGENWERILYVDDKTGVIDVNMHPTDPNTLLVSTYERKRDDYDTNDPAKRFGPGSAIWKTTDAGQTWVKLTEGLPTNELGRIDIEYYAKDPNVVYALVESSKIGQEPEDAPYAGFEGENADVGARLTNIVEEGPAERYGLKSGDIVVSMEGETVQSYNDFIAKIRRHSAGDTVLIEVSRDREPVEIELTFEKRPGAEEDEGEEGNGRRAPNRRSPFRGSLGGQVQNVQDQQGPDGHEYGGLYKSTDGGESWKRINSVNPRPMYFSCLRVDPSDDNYIYVLGVSLYKSEDNGETFSGDGHRGENGSTHVDHHAMWIDPVDGRHIILGNDGGIYVTRDRMTTWDHHNQFAIGQFYHVGVGPRRNYMVYGGLQDNGSWGGPSRVSNDGGPINEDWFRIGGGDGFLCFVSPDDPDQLYAASQNGNTFAYNIRTGERGSTRPRAPRGVSYRWNWRTPFMLSHHNADVYYSAGNYVFRSFNKGDGIEAISPEITNTDRGAGTAIDESPRDPKVIYVGTDDGAFWATTDGGQSWTDLFPGHKQEPEEEEEAEAEDEQEAGEAPAEESPTEEAADETAADTPVAETPAAETEPAAEAASPPAEARPARPGEQVGQRRRRAGEGRQDLTEEQRAEIRARRERGEGPSAEQIAQFRRQRDQGQTGQRRGQSEAQAVTPDDPIAGVWEARITSDQFGGGGERPGFTLDFTKAEDAYTGSMSSQFGDGEITNIKYNAETGELTFDISREQFDLAYTATVDGNTMTGEGRASGGQFTIPFEATRQQQGAEAADPGLTVNDLVPGPRRVSSIEASKYEDGRVYVTFDGHYQNDDAPYVLVSENYGKSWQSLTENLPDNCGTTRCIREDIRNPDVLYLGTEFAMFVSIDRGKTWANITANTNLPTVAIHEIAQHESSGDIIVGTHGRSIWILDGNLIRQLTPDRMAAGAHLYSPSEAVYWRTTPGRGGTIRAWQGRNPDTEAVIFYSLNDRTQGVTLEVFDHTGAVVTTLDAPTEEGLNRVDWNLRREPQNAGGNNNFRRRFGPRVDPGKYKVVLSVNDQTLSTTLSVIGDPDAPDAVLWGEKYDEWLEFDETFFEEEEAGPETTIH